ncbi:N-acetyl-anhydromuramyl-L-alanine amidase AmpD [Crossiella equi]|uniref:N-acetylmuramoyl-L-alanine amidase n=1 Tax=Crossiella equi TaxID=130796 RepID=A0ABS5A9Q7_9PSEU|nr:N-acetylmuramoyl-L-alanine amidase [Crossiella equi]MBP2472480.1 N-acetyl-anhydromuramyl-L-alanine amidase AmpD [Crossiella equi]
MFVRRRHLACGAAVVVLGALLSPVSSAAAPAGRQDAFTAAAAEFGVPSGVLLGVSYLQSRWDANAGQPSRGAGYGPLHLTDARGLGVGSGSHHDEGPEDPRGDTSRPQELPEPAPGVAPASLQTLDLAARLTGLSPVALRTDPAANIRGGAAVLASYQRELGGGTAAGDWYGAVARYSGATDTATARRFADQVFELVRTGTQRRTDDGQEVRLAADPSVQPRQSQVDSLGLRRTSDAATECPPELGCEWIPAPYEHYDPTKPGSYGNHDQANRPTDLKIKYIIVHDTEGYYDTTVQLVRNVKRAASWQYTLRSSDGHVAQHIKAEDVAWQAGNWYVNSHSIGLEHEGFAAKGTWYTEAMYRSSARLVRYLAAKYGIPLDRGHILGHDNVPGTVPATVRGMHWDPGPYWDWSHYFNLLGAPLVPTAGPYSGLVTIKPDFAANRPLMYGCDSAKPADPCPARGTTSVFLHTEPRADAPLVKDPGLRPDGGNSTRHVSDHGARVDTGQTFAVAERRGDWTAIWYLGQKSWFLNPRAKPTALNTAGLVVTPRPGLASVPVYGRAYPEAAAYEGTGVPVQDVLPLQYSLNAGERYALADRNVPTDYYFAQNWEGPRTVVRGEDTYLQVFFGHRAFFVKAADVRIQASW